VWHRHCQKKKKREGEKERGHTKSQKREMCITSQQGSDGRGTTGKVKRGSRGFGKGVENFAVTKKKGNAKGKSVQMSRKIHRKRKRRNREREKVSREV